MCKQLFPFFSQLGNPAFEVLDKLPDGLHQAVGGSDFPVQVADIRLDTTLFHLPDSSPLMDSRDNIKPLSGIGTQVHTLRAVIGFQIAVLDDLPFMPPDFTILLVVPVHRILLVAFPPAGWQLYPIPVLVKVINLAALGKPFPMFVHCPHSEQDMGVGIVSRRMGVMDGKVNNHSFGNKLLLAKLPDKDSVLVGRYFSGDGKHPPPCKLGVPLFFHRFGGVPQSIAVCIFLWGIRWEQDFIVDDTTLFRVVLHLLVVFTEQLFATLVSSGGNRRLPLAALNNRDFVVWTGHFVSLLSVIGGWGGVLPPHFGQKKSRRPFSDFLLGVPLCERRVFSCKSSGQVDPM